jgi:hypothetical protein
MKTLKRLVILAFVVVVAAAAWLRNSPLWALVEVDRGVRERDIERVERAVALERFATSSGAAIGHVVADRLGVDVGGSPALGSRLIGGLVGAFAKGVVEETAKEAARGMRHAIKDGRVEPQLGPLRLQEGLSVVGTWQTTVDGAFIRLDGTCAVGDGPPRPASLVIELERHDDGPFGGYPRRYVIVGVEPDSAKRLARECGGADVATPRTRGR